MTPSLITPARAAEIIGVSRQMVMSYLHPCANGSPPRLPSSRCGKAWLIRESDATGFVKPGQGTGGKRGTAKRKIVTI